MAHIAENAESVRLASLAQDGNIMSRLARLVDGATEEAVFFLARNSAAAEGAADEQRDSEKRQAYRNPGSHAVEPNHERV